METLESSRVCRLCGKQSGISIHIFDKNENHVKKINAVLPIMVHEMDLLPKHMCHRCSYKLEEFHKFYVDCLKTDADLKSQLSWMNNEDANQRVGIPMVHIENIKIKVEPPDYDAYDLNPVVANVNYINFPVNSVQPNDVHNGIAYTAYTRCRCCCDKTDQSNRTVPASYEDTVSSCDRLSNLEADDVDVRADKSLVVKKNVLTDKAFQERSSFRTTRTNESSDSSTCRPSSNSYTYSANVNSSGNESVSKSPVRNLRPRSSVNYVETRKKSQPTSTSNSQSKTKTPGNKIGVSGRRTTKFEVSPVKIENLSELEGRILRPRKKTVDYNVDKGKNVKGLSKARRSQDDERRAKRPNVENIPSELTLPSTTNLFDTVKLEIKEEQLSDLDDTKVNELITLVTPSHLLNNCETSSNFVVKEEPLPNNPFVGVQKDRVNGNTSKRPRRGATARAPSKFKPLRTVPNRNLNSGPKHVGPIRYAPKYLRSQDVFLRNGKTWKFESIEVSARTVQRSRATGRSLMKALRNMKKVPPSLKLLEDIKHYCEKCDISFPCKEIFRLHACYR